MGGLDGRLVVITGAGRGIGVHDDRGVGHVTPARTDRHPQVVSSATATVRCPRASAQSGQRLEPDVQAT
jgi:hypothetical protein